MRKKNRKRKLLIAASILIAVIAVSVLALNHYKNRIIKEQVAKYLPAVSSKLGVKILYEGIKSNPLQGTDIIGFKLYAKESGSDTPLIEIEKVHIAHRLKFRPRIHLKLGAVTFVKPKMTVGLTADGIEGFPPELLAVLKNKAGKGDEKPEPSALRKSGLSKYIDIGEKIEVRWNKGEMLLTEGRYYEGAKPLQFMLSDIKGWAQTDIASGKFTVDAGMSIDHGTGRAGLFVDGSGRKIEVTLTAKELCLAPFAPYLPESIRLTEKTFATGTVSFPLTMDSDKVNLHFDGSISGLVLDHWRLAGGPVAGVDIQTNGLVIWKKKKKAIEFPLLRVGNKGAMFNVSGSLEYLDEPILDTRISCSNMSLQKALDSLPRDLVPVVYGAKVEGELDLDLQIFVDMAKLHTLRFEPKVDIRNYRLVKSPPGADIKKLHEPFNHVAKKHGKVVKEFTVGPSNKDFIPFDQIGYYARRGVLTCEDGRFFTHNGFQLKHIRASIIKNLQKKRFVRGGSTISMQLAKNLFLSGEKNVSRKFQEMLLTYALENELSKERMFEIYMNIIEWGPGLYGIGPAARHYFYRSPAGLQPIEAAFLGSIIANPVRYHYMYSRGNVTDHWSVYLEVIVRKMGVGIDKYKEAEPYKPEFGWVRKKRLAEEKKLKEAQKDVDDEKAKESNPDLPK